MYGSGQQKCIQEMRANALSSSLGKTRVRILRPKKAKALTSFQFCRAVGRFAISWLIWGFCAANGLSGKECGDSLD